MTIEQIIQFSSDYFQIPKKSILGKSRNGELVEARHISMWLAKKYVHLNLVNISNRFQRKHSTIIYAINKIDNLSSLYPKFQQKLNNIETLFKMQYYDN